MSSEDCFDRKLGKITERRRKNGRAYRDFVDMAVRKALEDIEPDKDLLKCYSQRITEMSERVTGLSEENLDQERARLQSEITTWSYAVSNCISEMVQRFKRQVIAHLPRPHIPGLKYMLLGVEDKLLKILEPILTKFHEELKNVAKRLGLQNYSISIGVGIVQFTFTFGT
jgi:hypothetical protein